MRDTHICFCLPWLFSFLLTFLGFLDHLAEAIEKTSHCTLFTAQRTSIHRPTHYAVHQKANDYLYLQTLKLTPDVDVLAEH